jgi:hypothetical protein
LAFDSVVDDDMLLERESDLVVALAVVGPPAAIEIDQGECVSKRAAVAAF